MITQEIGKQYSNDKSRDKTGFLEKARLHQSKYRTDALNVPFEEYGNYLKKEDALMGLNFYDDFDIFQAVQKRYPNYSKQLYANMLRSEHIPFNFFVPFKTDLTFGKKVFNGLLNNQVQLINKIEIEYAPKPAKKYLNDRTSFDAYIEYTHIDNQKGVIGIEVKYTEHEYKLKSSSKEETDIYNKSSRYYQISNKCKLYKEEAIDLLQTDKYRQVWRNQLLGESIIIEDSDKFKYFTSLTIFPQDNLHFKKTGKEYLNMLSNNNSRFLPVTYEKFLSICKNHCPNDRFFQWINYLTKRYIVQN